MARPTNLSASHWTNCEGRRTAEPTWFADQKIRSWLGRWVDVNKIDESFASESAGEKKKVGEVVEVEG